jgi:hypothetical protein
MRRRPGLPCRPRWRMNKLSEDIAAAEAVLACAPDDAEARAALLYRSWFHAAPVAEDATAPAVWPTRAEYRATALSAAPLEDGWQVTGPGGDGRLQIAHADGRTDEAGLLDIVLANPLAAPAPGAQLQRRRRIERDVGGFWHLWSEPWAQAAPTRILRLYLPLSPSAMLPAAALLVGALPPDALWAMKFLSGPHIPGRRDPGVIYLAQGGLEPPFLAEAMAALAPCLDGERLRLSRPWQGGWVADDPGDGRSYGEAVSQTLAELRPGPGFGAQAERALAPLLGHLTA